MNFTPGAKRGTHSSDLKRITLRLPNGVEVTPSLVSIVAPANGLKVLFDRMSPNGQSFELAGLKGQLEQDDFQVTKSGSLVTVTLKKETKEKWGALFDRPKSAEPQRIQARKQSSNLLNRSIAGNVSMLEAECPRDYETMVSQRGVMQMARPTDLTPELIVI